jgi:hypothetical protein
MNNEQQEIIGVANNQIIGIKKNFWNYFPLILTIIQIYILIILPNSNLGLGAVFLFFPLLSLLVTIPFSILAIMTQFKKTAIITVSILFLLQLPIFIVLLLLI